jgi:hypothetical protein
MKLKRKYTKREGPNYYPHFTKMVSNLANSRAQINTRDCTRSQPLERGYVVSMIVTAWKVIIWTSNNTYDI